MKFAFTVMALLSAAAAPAAPVTWILDGVVLTDGQTLGGSFAYDATLGPGENPFTGISITNSGAGYLAADTWDTPLAFADGTSPSNPGRLYVISGPASQTVQVLQLDWAGMLTDGSESLDLVTTNGGLIALCGRIGSALPLNNCTTANTLFGGGFLPPELRQLGVQGGSLTTVPVPGVAGLLGIAFAGVAALRGRRIPR